MAVAPVDLVLKPAARAATVASAYSASTAATAATAEAAVAAALTATAEAAVAAAIAAALAATPAAAITAAMTAAAAQSLTHLPKRFSPRFPASSARTTITMARLLLSQFPHPLSSSPPTRRLASRTACLVSTCPARPAPTWSFRPARTCIPGFRCTPICSAAVCSISQIRSPPLTSGVSTAPNYRPN